MNYPIFSDEYFMSQAINEAKKALEKDEVPIGAIIVFNNKIIARAHNLTETLNDATAHAEMQAYTAASEALGSKYLKDCTMYVTLEPCLMCASAAYWTQISKIVFGSPDPKRGFSTYRVKVLHPKTTITGGILSNECKELLTNFFKSKRKLM